VRIEFFIFPPRNYCDMRKQHYHNHQQKSETESEHISLVLMRKRCEPVTQCFKRLELSLAKKLKPVFDGCEKNSYNKCACRTKICTKGSLNLAVSTFLVLESDPVKLEDSEMAQMTTDEFWSLCLNRHIQILVRCNDEDETEIPMLIECNPPTVIGVNTFEKFHGKIFPGIPLVVEIETLYASGAVVDWYLDRQLVCHDSSWYNPTHASAHKALGVVITPTRPDHNGKGFEEAYTFAETVECTLPENAMLQARPDWLLPRETSSTPNEVRVMSYNILAEQNANSMSDGHPFFPWVTAEILNRARRMPLILHELLSYNADVICLQEVDEIVYDTLFRPCMQCFNYQGYYSGKTSEGTREGCAVFFSLSKFQEAHEQNLRTFEISALITSVLPSLQEGDWKKTAQPVVDLLSRRPDLRSLVDEKLGHILQVVHLRDRQGNPLLVGNTHLFYHPDAAHIRALQCFAVAFQLSQEQGKEDTPFILCGDFNSELWNCGVLFIQRQTKENFCIPNCTDWRQSLNTFVWEENPDLGHTSFDDDFPQLVLPESFPQVISGYPEYPELTHCVVGFRATLDHILMSESTSKGSLTPIRQAPIPGIEQVTQDVAMPSNKFPSDHMSVVSDIVWKGKE
jgi:mRNA deadenylase 3'-5' endonuclease subunit Ccr4